MKTILLTGGTGFLGKHILRKFINEGYFILLLVREESDLSNILDQNKNFKTVLLSELEEIFLKRDIYGVVHCATLYRKNHTAQDIEDMISTNVTLPTILLDLCARNKVKRFINTGTFFEYDLDVDSFSEDSKISPFNLYASTKLSLLNTVDYYVKNFEISVVTLRLFSPYGPGDDKKIIPLIIQALISGKSIVLQDISQELHFTFTSDMTQAFSLSLSFLEDKKGSSHEIINIGSEKSISIAEAIRILELLSGSNLVYSLHKPFTQKKKTYCDTTKARNLIGWKESVSFERGLELTFNAFKKGISII